MFTIDEQYAMFKAAIEGSNVRVLAYVMTKFEKLDLRKEGENLLHLAIKCGNLVAFRKLLRTG